VIDEILMALLAGGHAFLVGVPGLAKTLDLQRVIVAGSSAGGLASAFVAFERPDLFGNVLSQSGAFWRRAEASDRPPYEWLTAHVMSRPKHNIRFTSTSAKWRTTLRSAAQVPTFATRTAASVLH
jgi:enterochelin esterase-like enzyme